MCEQVDSAIAVILFFALRVTVTLTICTIGAVVAAPIILVAVAAVIELFIVAKGILFRLTERIYSPLVLGAILLIRRRLIGALALELL